MKSNTGDQLNPESNRNSDRNDSASSQNKESAGQADQQQDFPGYPHYPSREDIMHPANKLEKVSADEESLTRSGAYLDKKNVTQPVAEFRDTSVDDEDELLIVPGTEADLTKDDLIILGAQDIELDEEEAVDSKVRSGDLDTGLDVPGEELDDSNEELGEEDEENNYYSLGGDRQESLEEN